METKVLGNDDTDGTDIASINTYPNNADIALVAAAKNGSRKAFDVLVKRHEQKIFFVAQRITRTREDAEDVVQQTFQKAFTYLLNFEGRSAFSTWLTRIAITESLMFLRRSRSLREVRIEDLNGDEESTVPLELPDASPDPEAIYSRQEQAEMLSAAINELSPGVRRAMQLHELDERSSEETAHIMGISISALKGRMFHGRRKLRQRLKHFVPLTATSARKASPSIGNTAPFPQREAVCDGCD